MAVLLNGIISRNKNSIFFRGLDFSNELVLLKNVQTVTLAITLVLIKKQNETTHEINSKGKSARGNAWKWDIQLPISHTGLIACSSSWADISATSQLRTILPFPLGFSALYKHESTCSRQVIFHCNNMPMIQRSNCKYITLWLLKRASLEEHSGMVGNKWSLFSHQAI